MSELVIVGAGGHGRELLATLAAINAVSPTWDVSGFVDDGDVQADRLDRLGSGLIGTSDWLCANPSAYALGIGTSSTRTLLADRLERAGCLPTTVVHPSAQVGPDVELGPGVVVYAAAVLTTNIRIGRHTHLNVGCVVQHDSTVGEFVQMSPGVFVNGDCTVGDGAFLGTGAIVTRGCSVGPGAQVGAGAVVLEDVPAGTTVVGVPAKVVT